MNWYIVGSVHFESLSMKYPVKRFKSLAIALKELEPFIRDGEHLQTGKPLKKFGGLRSREILANWLLCVAINSEACGKLTFSSDPLGGDGIILDCATSESWPTEHVLVPKLLPGQTCDLEDLIKEAIKKKCDKGGVAYAGGKTLVVFLNVQGQTWFPNRVARDLPQPLHFPAIWVVGFRGLESGDYVYHVVNLNMDEGASPVFRVRIESDFENWVVSRIQ